MPTTNFDVSERAGVPISTVAWLLNGRDRVHADTVRRVQRATVEFGFRLNALARALVTWRNETVGLLIPKFNSLLLFEIVRGVVDAILATNLGLLIFPLDITIVDFDDALLAGPITPLLATVHQPTYELGYQVTCRWPLAWSRRNDLSNRCHSTADTSCRPSLLPLLLSAFWLDNLPKVA